MLVNYSSGPTLHNAIMSKNKEGREGHFLATSIGWVYIVGFLDQILVERGWLMSASGFWIALHTNNATDNGIAQIDMLSALVNMITVTKRSLALSFSHSPLRVRPSEIGHHATRSSSWMGSSRLFTYGCSSLRLTLDFRAQRGGALEAGKRLGFELLQRYVERIKRISRISIQMTVSSRTA